MAPVSDIYHLDTDSGVYCRDDHQPFEYSDSDEVEERLLRVIRSVKDRSLTSSELRAGIIDWPSEYHLSPYRANVLRPFAEFLSGRVLEVGCGCGAITRFLGETSRSVVALDGSPRRASIAATRCAGLNNVSVFCDNFSRFVSDARFDVVTSVGVIEYSPLYFPGPDPVGAMLRRYHDFLEPDGHVLIAIENRLGLKYFAGAPEDHTGVPYQGLEDLYDPKGPVTLGRTEWETKLRDCGFSLVDSWYAFPDYKLAGTLVSSAALKTNRLPLEDILAAYPAPDRAHSYRRTFSETLVWPVIVRNLLVEHLANSFVLVARRQDSHTPAWTASAGVYHYSVDRVPQFSAELSIRISAEPPMVIRKPMFRAAPADTAIDHLLQDERLIEGSLYIREFFRIINRDGWSTSQVAHWARPWIERLVSASSSDAARTLPREYVDFVPFNLICQADGTLKAFDLEYAARAPLSLEIVVFRGLWAAFSRAGTAAAPAQMVPRKIVDLVFEIMSLFAFVLPTDVREQLIASEAALQSLIRGVELESVRAFIREAELRRRRSDRMTSTEVPIVAPQLFWRSSGGNFSEMNSVRVAMKAGDFPQEVVLAIPATAGTPCELRLDLADSSGVVQLFQVKALGADGNIKWCWDGTEKTLAAMVHADMIYLSAPTGAGVYAILTGKDPRTALPIPADVLSSLPGGRIYLEMAWLGSISN